LGQELVVTPELTGARNDLNKSYPEDLLYTKDHEWAQIEDRVAEKVARIGITAFAVESLGDVTQVELPKEGETVTQGKVFGSVESVKAVSDLFAPLSGRVVASTPLSPIRPRRSTTPRIRRGG
jgi:glycine cleavage system H lipoate-binding protein